MPWKEVSVGGEHVDAVERGGVSVGGEHVDAVERCRGIREKPDKYKPNVSARATLRHSSMR